MDQLLSDFSPELIIIQSLVLLCIALTSPIVIDKLDPLNRKGKDIVLAIDASGSMNSTGYDVDDEVSDGQRLNRFEITKKILTELILN